MSVLFAFHEKTLFAYHKSFISIKHQNLKRVTPLAMALAQSSRATCCIQKKQETQTESGKTGIFNR